jgi:hypothetical protein
MLKVKPQTAMSQGYTGVGSSKFWSKQILMKFLMYNKNTDSDKLSYSQKKAFEDMTAYHHKKQLYQ